MVLRGVGEASEGLPGLYPVVEKFYAREVTRKLGRSCEKIKIREDEIFSIDAVPFLYCWLILDSVSSNS